MARHIERKDKNHSNLYAVLNVPKEVQKKLGKKRFRKSLKTHHPEGR